MGKLTQEFTEVVTTIDGEARLTQEFVEVVAQIDGQVRLTQEFAEVVLQFSPSFRMTQFFIEVVCIPGQGVSDYGVWPMERLKIMPAIQGQKLSPTRGLK